MINTRAERRYKQLSYERHERSSTLDSKTESK